MTTDNFGTASKHYAVRTAKLKERFKSGEYIVKHIDGEHELADILTIPISVQVQKKLIPKIMKDIMLKVLSSENVINNDNDVSQMSLVVFHNIEKLEGLCRSKESEYEERVRALDQCKTLGDNIPPFHGPDSSVIVEINKSIEEAKTAERNAYANVEEVEKLKRAKK